MKKITEKWPRREFNLFNYTTPYAEIKLVFPKSTMDINLYWTKGGMYDPQTLAIVWDGLGDTWSAITKGSGYSKPDHMLGKIMNHFKFKIPNYNDRSGLLPYEYKVGGNYWLVNMANKSE